MDCSSTALRLLAVMGIFAVSVAAMADEPEANSKKAIPAHVDRQVKSLFAKARNAFYSADFDEERTARRNAIQLLRQWKNDDSWDIRLQSDYLKSLDKIATLPTKKVDQIIEARSLGAVVKSRLEKHNFDVALPMSRKMRDIYSELLGDDDAATLESRTYVAVVLNRMGRTEESLPLLQCVTKLYVSRYGHYVPAVALLHNEMASAYGLRGKRHLQLTHLEKAIDLSAVSSGADSFEHAGFVYNLARIQSEMGQHADALKSARKADEIFDSVETGTPEHRHYCQCIIFESLFHLERHESAVEALTLAFSLAHELEGDSRGHAVDRLGKFVRAYERSIEMTGQSEQIHKQFEELKRSVAESSSQSDLLNIENNPFTDDNSETGTSSSRSQQPARAVEAPIESRMD